ncbi:Retrotransposable element Tf2 protein [Rhizoctonia solani]|uniref:Retrotransposable element Tf2 protein n=1 Tax=Rhizoctonia solani TaxID=456999 RepID=A0A8H8NTJ8_9AGAM|nr:Retrotransposable element Tf2 protein [Rhizoctonia solani]QRW17972.1 Retrotransposable element Tf2 protein [Rhizoctonia solani]
MRLFSITRASHTAESLALRVKLESPEPPKTTPNTSWAIPHTQEHLDLNPEQPFIRPTPVDLPSTSQAATSNPLSKGYLSAQPGETDEEKEARTLHNIATIMGRALSVPLQSTFRGLSQTPGPAQAKSKIPAPEKYDSKKGPAAKSFIMDCKTYFLSNASSFPSDHTFLRNWSNPAVAQIAEQHLRKLKQLKSASNYATEFRIIASKLEWSDPALIASFCQGLKAEVRSKLIEYTLHKNITALDKFISTACLNDDMLFEARKELRKDSNSSTSSPQHPAQGHSSNFVSKKIQEARRNAGECSKCGEKSHKWEDCKNGWCLKTIERSKPESGKATEVESWNHFPKQEKSEEVLPSLQTNKSPLLTIDIEGITDTQTALIDSGSSANFIDPQFALSHNIPLIELDSPHSVIGINGKQVRNPICFKAWLVFSSQNRQFSAIFYALPLGNRKLILGTPWLKLADPDIDWTTMKVSLCLATEAQAGSINPEPQNLPVEFQDFQKVFSEEFFTTLPEHCPYDIAIDLEEDKQPPYGPIYSVTPAEREALKEHIDSELAAGKIVPTTSPAGAPVIFVKRADGRLCLVVDYCQLNAITIKDTYALPRQDKLIEKLCHAKIFTKLDLRNGYHNIRIKEGDEWKAAFCTALGHFAPTVMQFGLSNAPAVFMRFMNNIFRDLLDISVVVYLDDILIFSNSREEHVEHVKEVLSCLLKHKLFCNPAKCYFFVTEVTYIGLVITPEGISMEKDKVQAIMDWPEPQDMKQVQSFLGFANFYHCFVPNFSCLARPLNILTQKEQPWIWLEEQKAAFDAIKAEICKEPVLAHPDESKPYTLETDASGAAMGAVLSQRKEDGCLHPVAFMSASFSPAELNYDMHDKELLAITCAFEHWRIFLEGTEQPITVFTDHKNLEYWKSARTFNRRHSQKPDALSRQPDHMDLEPSPQVMIPESHFEAFSAHIELSLLDQIKEATQEDPSLDTILLAVSDPKSTPHSIAQKFKDYTIQKGLLLYQGRVVVPDEPEIKQQLLSHFHDSPASGHQGRA